MYFCSRKRKRNFRSSESRSKRSLIMPSRERKCRFAKRSGNSSVGRARPCQGRGREFESRFPLKVQAEFSEQREQKQTEFDYAESRQKLRFAKRSGNSSVGRARPCQGRGREFESRFPLHKVPSQIGIFCVSA